MLHKGFTIIELLIAIVVITILAAISIVAYTGLQDHAHNTVVQAELRTIGNQLLQDQTLDIVGRPPSADEAGLAGKIKVSKGSYNTANITSGQFAYCRNNEDFALLARSKANITYMFTSSGGSVRSVVNSGNLTTLCTSPTRGNISAASNGYAAIWLIHPTNYSPDIWAPWIE